MLKGFNYPIVLKQLDSAFSLGVSKAANPDEALEKLKELFKKTNMVFCQEFIYSDYVWRIGVLDNNPLFSCKYFMTENHWQIYHWESVKDDKSGNFETVDLNDVPSEISTGGKKSSILNW